MNDDYQRRVAYHEAGHVVAAYLLGCRIAGPISIEPGKAFAGIAFVGGGHRVPEHERSKIGLAVPMLPARFRRAVETQVMVDLAGPAAEFLATGPVSGFIPDPPDEHHARELARIAVLTQPERGRLHEARQREGFETDDERAFNAAWALAGREAVGAYLAWLRAETQLAIHRPRAVRLIEILAHELLDRRTISGRLARAVLTRQSEEQDLLRLQQRAAARQHEVAARTKE